ncbi:MFS transporter [Sporosarcina ureae]|uniref:MFS transporter n=1 Tax=Sporosarcina ureae TaxID=1571 RepID=UPI0028A854E6|nr:MFS transporter [Sporosarcina ureae]
MSTNGYSNSYEWKAVLLLSLGFGLLSLDRWMIAPLFPIIMEDLNLNYQDLGNITAVLALTWGVASILLGGLSDKLGRRKVLIPSIIGFSLLAGLTGLASGLTGLLLLRALMGFFEGGYTPVSVALTQEASKESRRGLNIGIQQCTFALIGLGLGPIIATQLLKVVPSWHWVFVVSCIPGFIVAYLLYRVIREPEFIQKPVKQVEKRSWSEIFKYRNVILCMIGLFGLMSCFFVIGSMMPNYLTDYLNLSISEMGFISSAVGFGGFAGALLIPFISDHVGRKPVLFVSFIIAIVSLVAFTQVSSNQFLLFSLLFVVACCTFGNIVLLAAIVSVESVPPVLAASAAGIPIGTGEIFGGGAAPAIAGFVAQNYGIQNIFYIGIIGLVISIVISLFLVETAPVKVAAKNEQEKVGMANSVT